MKKFWKSLMFAALGLFALSSCEDVPAPYDIPNAGSGEQTQDETILPEGSGTLENPYNVAAAIELINALEADVESSQAVYIKGKVAANSTTESTISQYGNMTFTMYDEGNTGNTFTAFQVYGPGNKKFTAVDQIKAGDEVVVYGKVVNYRGNTPETVGKGQAYVYSINGSTEGGETPSVTGIEVTCAEAVAKTNALADGATSAEVYTVTGYITEVVGSVSRNQQTFWMADTKDGGRVFEAYYADLPEGVSEFKAGAKVKITGNLTKYVNNSGQVTAEIKNAKVEILENGNDTPDTPVVGTEVTCAEAAALTNELANGASSAEVYTVTGYITEVVGSVSRNQQTFWMADTQDGGRVFEAYYADLPSGTSAFKAGMKVKITGNLTKYVNNSGQVTPEIKNAKVEILEGGNDTPNTPDTPDVSGNSITFGNMGYNNSQDFNGQTITVGDATLTWSKGSGSTTPKYYDTGSGMRLYGSNTLTIASSKTISKVEFTYASGEDSNNRPFYATANNTSFTPGTYDYSAQAWSGSAKSIVMTYTGQGGHVRIQAITITYAE